MLSTQLHFMSMLRSSGSVLSGRFVPDIGGDARDSITAGDCGTSSSANDLAQDVNRLDRSAHQEEDRSCAGQLVSDTARLESNGRLMGASPTPSSSSMSRALRAVAARCPSTMAAPNDSRSPSLSSWGTGCPSAARCSQRHAPILLLTWFLLHALRRCVSLMLFLQCLARRGSRSSSESPCPSCHSGDGGPSARASWQALAAAVYAGSPTYVYSQFKLTERMGGCTEQRGWQESRESQPLTWTSG
ncbi:uncharacterized protein B0H18DRAFT_667852 [Fomitopsis serialis]|uniref:uncharacterized protein n=1 Tax=Fomitopsis serialis TaxID=139415 RepID=UPI00200892D5|nr:uncharacterized protein B0H18DRAFT_667852 [Neoantrodia serialis]KAH9918427.1 hypothetical protein B0H18DRAFT_667852 [Neoantrodia serialis]